MFIFDVFSSDLEPGCSGDHFLFCFTRVPLSKSELIPKGRWYHRWFPAFHSMIPMLSAPQGGTNVGGITAGSPHFIRGCLCFRHHRGERTSPLVHRISFEDSSAFGTAGGNERRWYHRWLPAFHSRISLLSAPRGGTNVGGITAGSPHFIRVNTICGVRRFE